MTPERLSMWLYKTVPGGVRLQLVHEQALTGGITIASWTRAEVDEARETPVPGQSIAELLIEAGEEHANNLGESCRFLIQWVGEQAQPLRTLIHRAAPTDKQSMSDGAALAGNVTGNAMTGQLLAHIAQQQKVINGSIGVILTAYERAMTMQQQMIQQLAARLDALPPADVSNEHVTAVKIRAFEKLADLGPDVGRLAIAAMQRFVEGDAGGGSTETKPPTNGVS
jgi:hypothetical protein